MAKKKGEQLIFCCDFRYLNAVNINDAYSTPRIDESLSKLGDAKFFTTLDLGSAFWKAPLRKKNREKTGFASTSGKKCQGDLSKTDGSGFDQLNQEVWESRDVLRG